jgi:hypothetical protein
MNRLKTIATWVLLILQLKNLQNFHVIIQALNTILLRQQYEVSIMIVTFTCLIYYVL